MLFLIDSQALGVKRMMNWYLDERIVTGQFSACLLLDEKQCMQTKWRGILRDSPSIYFNHNLRIYEVFGQASVSEPEMNLPKDLYTEIDKDEYRSIEEHS